MPTIGIKRDLLFQKLGKTYSKCTQCNLATYASDREDRGYGAIAKSC